MASRKPPRLFRKPVRRKRYERKVRNRIYLEPDRDFLDSILDTEGDEVHLSRELTGEESARLAKLVKQARKNRGAVRTGKLALLAAVVAGVIVFNLVFKDALVQRSAEAALEGVFGARAEFVGLVFRPLIGEVVFASLTVADQRKPMTNLFQLGPGRFSVDVWRAFNGSIIIDDLSVSGIAFATPRGRSGELPEQARPEQEPRVGSPTPALGAIPPVAAASFGLPDTLDAKAFVERHLELLETPLLVEALAAAGMEYVSGREREILDLTADGTATAVRLQDLSTTDFAAIRSVEEALRVIDEANTLVRASSEYATTVRAAAYEAVDEARSIIAAAARVPDTVQSDYERVRAEIPDIRAQGREFLVGLVEPYMREALGDWYDRILLGWRYAEALRARESEPRARAAGRAGRRVDFAVREYPVFELARGFASASGLRERELVLEALSSDQEKTGSPTRITYRDEGATLLALAAIIDRRPGAPASLSLSLTSGGERVSIDRGLEALDVIRVDATTDVALSLLRTPDAAVSGTVALVARSIAITGLPSASSIGELVRDVLTGPEPLEAEFGYSISPDGRLSIMHGSTNLDERIAGAVQERIDRTLDDFRLRVEDELDQLVGPYLERLTDTLAEVVDLQETFEELLALANDREAAAAALQARAVTAVDTLRTAVEAEARVRLEAARAEAEAAAREQAERARAQAEEVARREAERARAQAEEAARREAERVIDRLRPPGF